MTISLNWNRQGTKDDPRYVAGVIRDGKIAVLDDRDLVEALAMAWRQFAGAVLPLNAEANVSGIRCYFNFSAGGVTFAPLRRDSAEGRGSVYLVTGNFVEAWSRAAPLDQDETAFKRSIEQQQRYYAARVLNAAIAVASDLTAVNGKSVLFSAVGTPRLFQGAIGSEEVVDFSSVAMPPETQSLRAAIEWKKISDVPDNVIYCGTARGSIEAKEFASGIQRMWQLMESDVVPLNQVADWDHVRCEFAPHSGEAVVFVAKAPFQERIDRGSCRMELPNFHAAWAEYERDDDIQELRRKEGVWARAMIAAAEQIRLSRLEGMRIEFWDDDILLWTTTIQCAKESRRQ